MQRLVTQVLQYFRENRGDWQKSRFYGLPVRSETQGQEQDQEQETQNNQTIAIRFYDAVTNFSNLNKIQSEEATNSMESLRTHINSEKKQNIALNVVIAEVSFS